MRTVRLALLLVLALGFPGPDAWADAGVQTSRPGARVPPLPNEEGVFHFLIFGDRNGGPPEGMQVLRQAVRDANLLGPDLVMTVGDMVYGYNEREEWLAQMAEYRGAMDTLRMPWFPVAGNHDVYWAGKTPAPPGQHEADYEMHFGPLWYWFGHKNAAFFVLYSDEGNPDTNRKGWGGPEVNRFGGEQLKWLRDSLQEAKRYEHAFVFLHHPRWISGSYPGTNWDKVHDLLREAGNVTAVFAGHIHRQRYDGAKDGIEYFTLATTGGSTPMDAPGTTFLHHANLVTVRKGGITVATIPVGSVLDPREMTPGRWAEIDALRGMAPVHDAALDVDGEGRGQGEYRVRVANPTSRPLSVNLEVVTGEDGTWWFTPDHRHALIPPGRDREVGFHWRRVPLKGMDDFEVPFINLQIDYLAETSRVVLPARPIPFRVGLPPDPLEDSASPGRESALRLEGGRECLELPSPTLDLPDGPFTTEAWVRGTTFEGRRGILSKAESSEYGLFVLDGKPEFSVFVGGRNAVARAQSALLEPSRWHHLAGVFDGREVRLYADGRKVAAVAGEGARLRNLLPILIGADPDRDGQPTSPVVGLVDEVRVSTVARYSGDSFTPARRFRSDADTALLLHLDRGIGLLAPDSSSGRRHALAKGRVDYVPAE